MANARVLAVLVFVVLNLLGSAAAHELRPGYLEIVEQDQANYQIAWKAPLLADRRIGVDPVFPPDCATVGAMTHQRSVAAVTTQFALTCEAPLAGRPVVLSGLEATLTDVIIRFTSAEGNVQTARATASSNVVILAAKQGGLAVAVTYAWLGVEHIFGGIDHLLFLLALVMLISGVRRLVEAVTAFTVAHSLTLIATTLGLVSLPPAPVEAVIALSIVFLAREIVLRQPGEMRLSERKPWLVAFAFGLLHGFGFAGALSAIGLPDDAVPLALLSFNLGVEIGQLGFVLGATGVMWLAHRFLTRRALDPVLSYGIGITASVWLIERTWG